MVEDSNKKAGNEIPCQVKTANVFSFFTDASIYGKENSAAGNRYKLGEFQRNYSWKDKNIKDLLTDLDEFIREGGDPFSLGALILFTGRSERLREAIKVIDGQQRIITILLIIQHLTSRLDKEINVRCQKLSAEQLIEFVIPEESDKYQYASSKKSAKERNSHSADKVIELPEPHISDDEHLDRKAENRIFNHSNLFDNSLYLIEKHFEFSEAGYRQQFLDFLLDKVFFIVITTEQDRHINKIFETLNDRGMPLLQVELFKNFVLGQYQGKEVNEKHNIFMDCYRQLGNNMERVDDYFLIKSKVRYGHHKANNKDEWYRFWKDIILKQDGEERVSYLDKLLEWGDTEITEPFLKHEYLDTIYEDVVQLNKRPDDSLSRELLYYKVATEVYPAASAKKKYGVEDSYQQRDSFEQMLEFLKKFNINHALVFALLKVSTNKEQLIDSINVLYVIMRRIWLIHGLSGRSRFKEILDELAHRLYKGRVMPSGKGIYNFLFARIRWSDTSYVMNNEAFFEAMAIQKYDKTKDIRVTFVLESVAQRSFHYDSYIVRILPDNSSSLDQWPDFIGKSRRDRLTPYHNYRDRLGNMVLLEKKILKDEKISQDEWNDMDFDAKRELCEKSSHKETQQIGELSQWTRKDIDSIQGEYATTITKILYLPF